MRGQYLGDFAEDATVFVYFWTFDAEGVAAAPDSAIDDADVVVYKDNGTTESTTGITVTSPFDTRVGFHLCTIDTSAAAFYSVGSDYEIVLSAAETVDSVALRGSCKFSIENRITGQPAGATLAADLATIKTEVDKIGTIPALDGGGQTIGAAIAKLADDNAGADFDATNDSLERLANTAPLGTAMRGTDNAALASVLGALADAAAVGDVTTSDTLMQYLKQLLNELSGGTGIGTMPSGLNPANGVNLFEMLRAAMGATFDTATDSNEQLQIDHVALQSAADAIKVTTDKFVFTVANQVDANMVAISDDATAAAVFEALMDGAVVVQVNATSSTTTAVIDGFSSTRNDQFKGRLITILNGVFEQTDITGYVHATQTLTFTAVTGAPANDVFMVIH